MVSPSILRKRITLVVKVAMGHVAVLALMFAILQTRSCQTEKTQVTKVRLVSLSLPQDKPARSTDLRGNLDNSPKLTHRNAVYRTPEMNLQRVTMNTSFDGQASWIGGSD